MFWSDFRDERSLADGCVVYTHERLRKARRGLVALIGAGSRLVERAVVRGGAEEPQGAAGAQARQGRLLVVLHARRVPQGHGADAAGDADRRRHGAVEVGVRNSLRGDEVVFAHAAFERRRRADADARTAAHRCGRAGSHLRAWSVARASAPLRSSSICAAREAAISAPIRIRTITSTFRRMAGTSQENWSKPPRRARASAIWR